MDYNKYNRRRILLTSTGFTNKNIEKIFIDNIHKPLSDVKVIFVPTAANDPESKSIVPECYKDLTNAGIPDKNIMWYDLDRQMNLSEIMAYDAIYFCGGSEKYLIKRINQINFEPILISAINNGIFFIGVSAGSMIVSDSVKNGLGIIKNKLEPHCEKNIALNGNINLNDNTQIRLSDNQALWIYGDRSIIVESCKDVETARKFLQDKKEFIYDLRGDENMSDLYENINENASTAVVAGLFFISLLSEKAGSNAFNNYAKQKYGDALILMSDLTRKRICSSVNGLLLKKKKNWTMNHPTELVDFLQKYDNELYNKYKDKNIICIDQYSLKNDKSGNIFFANITVFNPFNNRTSLFVDEGIKPVEYKYIPINSISKKYSSYYIIGSLKGVDRDFKDILNRIKGTEQFHMGLTVTDYKNIVESRYPQVKEFEKSLTDFFKNNKSKKTDDKSTTNTKDKNKTSKETNVNESTLLSKERNKLDDDVFGIPSLRKYPLNDKSHVLAAIRMFNRVDRKHEKELAHNIIAAMEKYKISKDIIGPKNRLQSYI